MKKTIAILITLFVLIVGSVGPTPKAKADGGCQSGVTVSGNCVSQFYCVIGDDGCLYMQYHVCCSGRCFIYMELVSCGQ